MRMTRRSGGHVPQDRRSINASLPERRVPNVKHRVSESNHLPNVGLVGLLEQVGLSSLGVDVGVGSEEGHEGAGLIESDEELGSGVLREFKQAWWSETPAFDAKREERLRKEGEILTPKKPPTSAPANVIPAIPLVSSIGKLPARWSHVPRLSPVQTAPHRCEPEKKDRERTKGRLAGVSRSIKPRAVSRCCKRSKEKKEGRLGGVDGRGEKEYRERERETRRYART
jgi:hypothetical protein